MRIQKPSDIIPSIDKGVGVVMISTRGRYALRVMLDLAGQAEGECVPLKEVAARQDISEKYLEAIMKRLVEAGLVSGLRGKRGGYRLGRPPEACSVGEILRAAEGSLSPVACLGKDAAQCPRQGGCAALPLWRDLEKLVGDYLDGVTLGQLLAQSQEG